MSRLTLKVLFVTTLIMMLVSAFFIGMLIAVVL